MKNLLKTSALVATLALGISSANATNNYSANDTFTLTIDFVTAISISVDDVTINNVVGGDTIDKDVTMTPTKDTARSATCSTTDLTLSPTSGSYSNITDIEATVNTGCTLLSLDGVLPTDAPNGIEFQGTITITYAYDVTTLN